MHQHIVHSATSRPDPRALRRARRVLTALIIPVLVVIIIGIATLYSSNPVEGAKQ
ncbi:hypothetical protein [Varibaculum vaginae]|uniref:hypothetical protein n=1 Tax=Varibaculum vaginae TaxID=2364797 RepID=UPI00135BD9D1|nr:hypothetical protein [Varibaculum vaginae]